MTPIAANVFSIEPRAYEHFTLTAATAATIRNAIVAVCIGVMLASGVAVSALLALLGVNSTVIKLVVDFLLFFVNYRIQRAWVFPQKSAVQEKGDEI